MATVSLPWPEHPGVGGRLVTSALRAGWPLCPPCPEHPGLGGRGRAAQVCRRVRVHPLPSAEERGQLTRGWATGVAAEPLTGWGSPTPGSKVLSPYREVPGCSPPHSFPSFSLRWVPLFHPSRYLSGGECAIIQLVFICSSHANPYELITRSWEVSRSQLSAARCEGIAWTFLPIRPN